jgi:hypothetical protein
LRGGSASGRLVSSRICSAAAARGGGSGTADWLKSRFPAAAARGRGHSLLASGGSFKAGGGMDKK